MLSLTSFISLMTCAEGQAQRRLMSQILEFREAFSVLDREGLGQPLNPDDLSSAMERLGLNGDAVVLLEESCAADREEEAATPTAAASPLSLEKTPTVESLLSPGGDLRNDPLVLEGAERDHDDRIQTATWRDPYLDMADVASPRGRQRPEEDQVLEPPGRSTVSFAQFAQQMVVPSPAWAPIKVVAVTCCRAHGDTAASGEAHGTARGLCCLRQHRRPPHLPAFAP